MESLLNSDPLLPRLSQAYISQRKDSLEAAAAAEMLGSAV